MPVLHRSDCVKKTKPVDIEIPVRCSNQLRHKPLLCGCWRAIFRWPRASTLLVDVIFFAKTTWPQMDCPAMKDLWGTRLEGFKRLVAIFIAGSWVPAKSFRVQLRITLYLLWVTVSVCEANLPRVRNFVPSRKKATIDICFGLISIT